MATNGRHVLAQYSDDTVVVYQAYRPSIARYALEHGHFGGEFRLERMSWIKPNFLWMMYRSGWDTKRDQDVVLAVHLERDFFEHLLSGAVPSTFDSRLHSSRDAWKQAVASSDVRIQWDPDHGLGGEPLARRALQLGLRGAILRQYAHERIRKIEDCSEVVTRCRGVGNRAALMLPRECIFTPRRQDVAVRLGLAHVPHD